MQHKIEAIQLELTNACGLDCAECPRRYMTRKVGMMDFELACKGIKNAIFGGDDKINANAYMDVGITKFQLGRYER